MTNGNPGSFWYFNAGHVLSLVGVIVTIGIPVTFGTCSLRDSVRDTVGHTASLQTAVIELAKKVDGMDLGGTQFSRNGIPKEAELIRGQNDRIDFVSKQVGDMTPKVATLERDMAWMRAFLESEKGLPNPDKKGKPN